MPARYHLACAIDNTDFSSGRPDINEPEIKVIKSFETRDQAINNADTVMKTYNKHCGEECRVSGCILFDGSVIKEF